MLHFGLFAVKSHTCQLFDAERGIAKIEGQERDTFEASPSYDVGEILFGYEKGEIGAEMQETSAVEGLVVVQTAGQYRNLNFDLLKIERNLVLFQLEVRVDLISNVL